MQNFSLVQIIAVSIIPVIFAITLHEVAHGWVAMKLGDDTAERQGRLSVNPIRHIDPVGTLIIPGLLLLLKTGVLFGWAKPVPVDFNRLNSPRTDMALVAVAGPMANLLMALFWALVARIAISVNLDGITTPLSLMSQVGISMNIVLMLLNLLPIPPLDGGRIAVGLLPYDWAVAFSRIEPYGFYILLGLMFSGLLSSFLDIPMSFLQPLMYQLAGF